MIHGVIEPYDSVFRIIYRLQIEAAKGDLTGAHEATTQVIDLVTKHLEANSAAVKSAQLTEATQERKESSDGKH